MRFCRSGSVNVNMTLVFTSQNAVPSVSNATSLLRSELSNSTLNIIPGSISTCELKRLSLYTTYVRKMYLPCICHWLMHFFFFVSYFRFNINFKHCYSAHSWKAVHVFTNTDGFGIISDRLLDLLCTELAYDLMVLRQRHITKIFTHSTIHFLYSLVVSWGGAVLKEVYFIYIYAFKNNGYKVF